MTLKEERIEIVRDAVAFKKPKRVPTFSNCSTWHVLNAGYSFKKALSDWNIMLDASVDFIEKYDFDLYKPLIGRNPINLYEIMKANKYVVTDDGINITDINAMSGDDYDAFLDDRRKFMWEKALPANSESVKQENAFEIFDEAIAEYRKMMDVVGKLNQVLAEHEVPRESRFGGGGTRTPMEDLANYMRGFKGLAMDIRRHHDELKHYVEVMTQRQLEALEKKMQANENVPNPDAAFDFSSGNNSHSAMNYKQVGEFIWPFYKEYTKLLEKYHMTSIFTVQAEILRLADYYDDVPKGTLAVGLEMDNPFEFRKRLPNICILGGMTTELLGYGTKEECTDYAKKLIDELGTEGGFIMSQNKLLTYKNDATSENLKAVNDFVKEYKI